MSIVSNTVGSIINTVKQAAEPKSEYDSDDKTFSNLLDKQMQASPEKNWFDQFYPSPQISGIDGIDIQDLITSAHQQKSKVTDTNKTEEIGSAEMVAFLSRPFDSYSVSGGNTGLMNFAKKHAANFYNKCASNVVTDLAEFVEDTLSRS